MSVSTPILTTSSEICAFAAVPDIASTTIAAIAAAGDFMISSPRLFVDGFGCEVSSIRPGRRLQSRLSGHREWWQCRSFAKVDDNQVLCPMVGWLFALYGSSHEVERRGQPFEGNRH